MMHTKKQYKRGDVVLVLFPNSDLRTAKLRPSLIVQADNLETDLSQVIVAMISSNISPAGHSSRIFLKLNSPEGLQSGLLADSVVMTDNLATISERVIDRVIGDLQMQDVDNALIYTLGLRACLKIIYNAAASFQLMQYKPYFL
ncbi:MAG: type II toxin-antitoxin system PemK/MazF family toxin, partial [Desulfamplus sp.]|nr:type II toxin-antitoxin system PemK/MazF family toxin [Desulfamplus sp.]